jgi:hypothetical protein
VKLYLKQCKMHYSREFKYVYSLHIHYINLRTSFAASFASACKNEKKRELLNCEWECEPFLVFGLVCCLSFSAYINKNSNRAHASEFCNFIRAVQSTKCIKYLCRVPWCMRLARFCRFRNNILYLITFPFPISFFLFSFCIFIAFSTFLSMFSLCLWVTISVTSKL